MKKFAAGLEVGRPNSGNGRGAIPASPFPGIHPVKHCLDRLFDKEVMALSRLLACEYAPAGLKQAAIAEHPRDVEARRFDLEYAACWELQRYGCILLGSNPYHQPQMFADERRAA